MSRTSWICVAVAAAVVLAGAPAAAKRFGKPNILIVLTDDQTSSLITGLDKDGKPYLPFIASKLGSARQFPNTYFAQSLCCPSRTTMLTGMYPHNHGVVDNGAPLGGYDRYMQLGLGMKSWPRKLNAGGYYVGHFGKIMNGYGAQDDVPPGWDWWFTLTHHQHGSMFNWKARKNERLVTFSEAAGDAAYMTNVLANDLIAAIKRQETNYRSPFAFILASTAPHLPAEPAKEFRGLYSGEPFSPGTLPNFNEADVSDKPLYIQELPPLTEEQIADLRFYWRRSIEAGRSLDKAFKRIWQLLEANNQLKNTFIIFASDNGYSWGSHRIETKLVPYQESMRSITYVWGPGVVPGVDERLVSNVDYFATFMGIAGRPVPAWVDGRSLLPILRGAAPAWRQSFLIRGFPPEVEGHDTDGFYFTGLVTSEWKFVRYETGEKEFYDLAADPYELQNSFGALDPAFAAAVEARMDEFQACAGADCRSIEALALPEE